VGGRSEGAFGAAGSLGREHARGHRESASDGLRRRSCLGVPLSRTAWTR
jgi:hypothetical protein